MQLLIIGGTVFLGRHIVESALSRGHTVTLFNRGQHNPDLFLEVEKIRGDRERDLDRLRGRSWDAVIDTSGYVPRIVELSAKALRGAIDRYVFISTISVYSDFSAPGIDETSPVSTLEDPSVEEITDTTYGPLKVFCEQEVERHFSNRALIVRPGLIVGPHDPTDRFTYWPHRVARGGEVLAPGRPDRTVQFIDVRDLADWTVYSAERGITGTFNADWPPNTVSFQELLETCRRVSGSQARFRWIDDATLLEEGVEPWMELPLWVPESEETRGFYNVDVSRAVAEGLTFRPLAETVRATLAWDQALPADREWQAGLSEERERAILAKHDDTEHLD